MHTHDLRFPVICAITACLPSFASAQCFETGFESPARGGLGMDGGRIASFAEFDSGNGPELYIAGSFTQAGSTPVRGIARWTGSGWADVGGGVTGAGGSGGSGGTIVVHDDGSGPALYAAGNFVDAGGVPCSSVARWDGTAWSAVGGGVGGSCFGAAVHDDGTGPALYVSGNFTTCGFAATPCSNLAKWDGQQWSDVGGGVVGPFSGGCCTYGLASFDDGSGPALFIGCDPGIAGGSVPAQGIVKWNGTQFQTLGSGLTNGPFNFAALMIPWNDGLGPALLVGGDFRDAGGVVCNHIASWNGTNWSNLGGGVTGTSFPYAGNGLALHDSGSGTQVCVGGLFTAAGGVPTEYYARWDQKGWRSMRGGVTGGSFTNGGPLYSRNGALWMGGGYTAAGGIESNFLARWSDNCPTLTADTVVIDRLAGGTQTLSCDLGPAAAGNTFAIFGTISGINPGDTFGLNADFYTPLAPNFVINGFGVLDANGRANSFVSFTPSFAPFEVSFHHVALTIGAGGFGPFTNPVEVILR